MKSNMKTLGLALGAMLALGALLAAGASAEGERFHSTEKNVILTGHSEDPTFRIGNESTTKGLTVTCKTGTYEGTVEGEEFDEATETWTTKEVTVHPSYDYAGECETPVGKATVDTHGCDYVLTSEIHEQNTGGGHIDEHATVEVECTEGKFIQITATGCTIKLGSIPENTLTTGVTYTNLGSTHEDRTVTVDATVDSIYYTSSGFLCGFAGIPKEGHNGFYEDDVTVEATEDLDIEGPCMYDEATHTLTDCDEGFEVGIWWE